VTALRRRRACDEDFEFLFDLTREALGPYVEEIWGWRDDEQRAIQRRFYERGGIEILEEDGVAIGCLAVRRERDHVFLDRIALPPAAQNRGLGTELVREVMGEAAALALPVRLSVLSNNPARRLYERLGFRVTEIVEPRIRMEWRPGAG
jgi:ribosomal protein S18 acetylase RimI-like enzyme